MRLRVHGLGRRLALAFACFSLLSALCFSAFCMVFVYVVEDHFFDRMLAEEAAHQEGSWAASGRTAPPLRAGTSLHRDASSFPPDLARQGPARAGEFFGEAGRHYHVRALHLAGEEAPRYLVAETSGELAVRPRLRQFALLLGGLALCLLLVTLGAGYWLARRATAPLSRLTALVAGTRPEELPRGFAAGFPDDEIGALAQALDQAMARIAAFVEREQHFTRDASHELRTPLAVIEGAAFLLAQQPLPGQAGQQAERIRQAAEHMGRTLRTLLALAREDAQGAWQPRAFAVLPMVEESVVRHAALAQGEVSVSLDARVKAECSADAFAILLDNLVANAFQHAPQGSVRIFAQDGWLVIEDDGPGLDAGVRERLGQPGVKRAGSAGFGLGLSITRRVAARAGIALKIEDGAKGGVRAALGLAAQCAAQPAPLSP
ncbi:hypothetical protein B0920_13395 [Massilia sp. KIM]|uniref:sensor histidine kinase n=1 Tax=Massilia sp. KIM TaxID=1955422 RepID=UPI00098FECCD|nr:HAMP domain-containing sensor histidine kinase [Massilia sp. KIM]OON64277.1 hypothetical protein B0920_13395 [Massilia sp. KIM]